MAQCELTSIFAVVHMSSSGVRLTTDGRALLNTDILALTLDLATRQVFPIIKDGDQLPLLRIPLDSVTGRPSPPTLVVPGQAQF